MRQTGAARTAEVKEPSAFCQLARQLARVGRDFRSRGWALGTSGNFSAVVSVEPLRLAITQTGIDKQALREGQVILVDDEARTLNGPGRPSEETTLHLTIVRVKRAGAV